MGLRAYVLLWGGLGVVSLAGGNTTEPLDEARQLIAELQMRTCSPASAAHRMQTLGVQKGAAVLLLEMLQKPMEAPTQQRLVDLLVLLSQPISAYYFLNSLKGEDAYLRMSAAKALGQLRVKEALPGLVSMLEDERLALRREAATALGRLKQKAAQEPLLAALQVEPEPEAREQMLWALGLLEAKKHLSVIQGFLTHSSESTRWAAARALLAMGEASGWKWLKPHLNSQESGECAQALHSLQEAVPSKSWKAEALVLLRGMMQEREAPLAAQAAVLAACWGDKSARLWLEKRVEQSEGMEVSIYEEALAKVQQVLGGVASKEKRH
ncbi:MAG: HEAT repeat domain-containing protein [Cystobacterineae bacterium]|nr:HEAT repeat domain-containing protein [Cystobacterineae bacterium]